MKVLTVVLVLLAAALAAFVLLNWTAIAAPAELSVGFTTVHAPLGLALLLASGAFVAALLVFVAVQQARALVEARRFARELRAERELAQRAEGSRFVELRSYLESELRALAGGAAEARADTHARIDRLEALLVARLAEVGNGLAAHVAEVEDKLDRTVAADGLDGRA